MEAKKLLKIIVKNELTLVPNPYFTSRDPEKAERKLMWIIDGKNGRALGDTIEEAIQSYLSDKCTPYGQGYFKDKIEE